MTTTTHRTTTRTTQENLKGLAAGIALLALIVGVPLGLSVIAPIGLPTGWPVWSELVHTLMRPDDGRLALAAIRVVAWAAWAAFTWSVVIETRAALRNTTAREVHLLGVLQRTAATLVGAALLALIGPTPLTTAAADVDVVAVQVMPGVVEPAPRVTPTTPALPSQTKTPRVVRGEPQSPVVTVDHGDSLWTLAERHLGDGERFGEIFDLNVGRTQPDGHALSDAHWIDPGWQLLLPADAINLPTRAPAEPSPAQQAASSIVVQPGDSLWELAQTHLGDGDRYTEIAALNTGVPQPDGHTLSDPDLIRPGWILALPGQPTPAAATTPQPVPDALVGVPDAVPDAPSTAPDAPSTGAAGLPDAGPDAVAVVRVPGAVRLPEADLAPRAGATSATTGTSSPSPEPVVADEVDEADHDPASTSPVALHLGLTALAAAGLIGELARRRRLQHRVRRTGERIAMPEPGSPAAHAERLWHAAPTPLTIAQIRTTLANLATACFTAGRDLPRIGAIKVAADHLNLHLIGEDPAPVAPFTIGRPRTWTAPAATLAAQEPLEDPGRPEPYPALVTIGHTETSTVLVNLEAAGTLHVTGDPDTAAAVLRALVAELATSELSGRIGLTADEQFTALSRACAPARLQSAPAPVPAQQLEARLAAADRALAQSGLDDTLQARSEREAPDLWLPVLYLHSTTGAPACPPWCGSVLLTALPGQDGWTLSVEPDGTARIDALDLTVQAQRLDPAGLRLVTELLSTATPPEPQPSDVVALRPSADAEARRALDDLPTLRPGTTPPKPDDAGPPGVRINVLGPVRIENLPPTGRRLSALQTELLVYLALHERGTGSEIDDALWPGVRGDDNRRHGLAYRTRRIVLDDALPPAPNDRTIRLGQSVTCDWQEFQRLAAAGLSAGSDGIDYLQRAINLVRGRPLQGVPPDHYAWSDHDIDTMINAVVDVAHALSRLLLDAEDTRGALSAAKAGLLADTCSERLRDDAIAAALAHGDTDEARRIGQRYDALLAQLDDELV